MADEQDEEPPAEKPKYDQEFFLVLAAKGKDAWNAWRRDPANKDVRVTFAGIDFSEAPRDQINFEGFEFGDDADFSRCTWRGVEWFEIRADPKAFAPGRAFFANAAFDDETKFTDAAFGSYADFSGAAFGHVVHFTGAAFGDCANFSDAAFGDYALFSGATLGYYAVFAGASFDHLADFKYTIFSGRVEFNGKPKEQRAGDPTSVHEMGADARTSLEKRYKESGPDRFLTISFANAHFGIDAHLEGEAMYGCPRSCKKFLNGFGV